MGYALAFGILAGAMIAFPSEAAAGAADGLALWARAVVPVLGPFLACMLMLSSRVGGGLWLRTVMGWLCGSPGGARLMRESGLQGRNALRAAAMTGTMSPMFFLGTVSAWIGNPSAGRLILFCHIVGALLLGMMIPAGKKPAPRPASPMPLAQAFRDSALALLTVAVCMMLGCAASRLTACAFPGLPDWSMAALQCALEVTGGVKALTGLGLSKPEPMVCAACSFGGLSILLQNAAFWRDSGVGAGKLLLLRTAHAIVSGVLCFVLTALQARSS